AAEKVLDRYAELVAGTGVADHRRDDVAAALERVHRADRRGLLARAEPRLRDHALPDPALQGEVVQAVAEQALIERKELRLIQRGDDGLALGVRFQTCPELRDQLRVRSPVDVLGRIVRCVTAHGADRGGFAETPRGVCAARATRSL